MDALSIKNNVFLFFLLLTPFIYIESLFDKVDLPRNAYIALIASLWLLTWLIQTYSRKNISFRWNPLFLLIIFLLFLASTSYFWGYKNMLYQAELYFYTSLVIICFMAMQVTPNIIIKFSSAATVTAAACAMIGILQSFNINPLDYQQIAPPAATFINRNFAVNFFDLILPLSITLFFISKDKKDAWISAIAISIIASYIILTKSRGAYLSTFITLSMFFIAIQLFPLLKTQITHSSNLYKKQILLIILIPSILYLIPSIFYFLPNNVSQTQNNESQRYAQYFSDKKQDSISSRFSAYQNSLSLFQENPMLGVGLGGFQQNFRPYLQSVLAKNKIFSDYIYLHNDPLQLLIELGIIGAGSALLFFIFLFRFSYLSIRHEHTHNSELNSERLKTISISFLIAIIASFSHSLFSFPYHQPTSAVFMALWIGFMLNLSARKISFSSLKKQKIIKILTLSTSLIFLLGITHFYYKYIKSSVYMKQSVVMNNCDKASMFAILSSNTYAKDYLSQSQGINIVASCPLDAKTQLLFAENILKVNPTHPWALYLAGISNFKLGNYDSSHKSLEIVSLLYPYFANSYMLIGHIAAKKKDYTKARSYYMKVLKLAPANSEAKNMLQQLDAKGY